MYAATRVYLKNCILRNFAFYNFSKYHGSQPLQEDRATLELLEIIYETVTLTKVLREKALQKIPIPKSPNFLVWIFCGKAQFLHSFGQIARNYAETVPFHKISKPGN